MVSSFRNWPAHKMRVCLPASTPSRVGLVKPGALHTGRFRRPLDTFLVASAGGAETRRAAQHPARTRTARPERSGPDVTGAQVCNHGGGSGLKLSQPGWRLLRETRLGLSFPNPGRRGAANPRPVGCAGTRAGRSSAPPVDPHPRIAKWTLVSLAPKNADREARKDPWARQTWQCLPPTSPVTSVSAGKVFLPRGGPHSAGFKDSAHVAGFRREPPPTTRLGAGPSNCGRCPAQPPPNGSPGWGWGGPGWRRVRLRAPAFRRGAWLARGPAQAWRFRPPHLPISSAWRRRCVRRGLPRVLRAEAAHWSLVLEAAAAAAAAPAAPPPPPVAAAPRARARGPAPSPPPRAPPHPPAPRGT